MGQYFSNEDLKSNIQKYNVDILGNRYSFYTDNGVFSKEKLDFGTRVLLENIPIEKLHGDILDVGCGYGVIDIVLGKLIDAKFLGVDVNRRALHLAEMNKKENKLSNIDFIESSCYENVSGKYDFIITNPPIRAGKKIVYEIVMGAKNYLKDEGSLFIVVRKEQGAKSMIRDLEEIYKVEILNKVKGFFVIKCDLG
ncbi:MAG: class I SAM-dependent methyltransferase [Firmicutes bacterium]|nr:class I SAM-dependent methyltransferase [Bacillota bacterium]